MQPVFDEKINFTRIESEALQHLAVAQLLAGVPPAVDPLLLELAAGIAQHRELELVHVLPVLIITGFREMFGADVGVEAVGKRIMDGADVPAGMARGFQQGYIVAAFH